MPHLQLMDSSPLTRATYRFLLFEANPFSIQLFYFITTSTIGFLLLKALPMRAQERPKGLDVFFMSTSAATVSSMGTVEMEAFSNSQLVMLTLLMLLGGEVFTSMLGLQFMKLKYSKIKEAGHGVHASTGRVELGPVRYLGYVVLSYIVVVHVCGATMMLVYLKMFPASRAVLERKGIHPQTFAFFVTVSSFTNCGFVPTNENMVVFKGCSGLLLIVAALVLVGNTMYPPCLRLWTWVLKKMTRGRGFDGVLRGEVVYDHYFPRRPATWLAVTAVGFVLVQFVLFCCLEWRSEGMEGMGGYRKAVAAMFMSVNTRHAGESVVDLSAISPAMMVLYVVMMLALASLLVVAVVVCIGVDR